MRRRSCYRLAPFSEVVIGSVEPTMSFVPKNAANIHKKLQFQCLKMQKTHKMKRIGSFFRQLYSDWKKNTVNMVPGTVWVEKLARNLREVIPGSVFLAPDPRDIFSRAECFAPDLRHVFPGAEYLHPELGHVFRRAELFAPDLRDNFPRSESLALDSGDISPGAEFLHPELGHDFPRSEYYDSDLRHVFDGLEWFAWDFRWFMRKRKSPESFLTQGFTLWKGGGLLLSRIALQYHRRRRA